MKTPPGPKGNFFWGVGWQAVENPLKLYMSSWKEFGDYVRLRSLPGYYWYMLTHPSAVEHILQTNQSNYRKPDIFNRPMSLLVGKGLVVSEGDLWLQQRRLIQPSFNRQKLAALGQIMCDQIEGQIRTWEKLEKDKVIDIAEEMSAMTLVVVGSALFGADLHEYTERVGKALRLTLEHVNYRMTRAFSFPESVPTKRNIRFVAAKKELDNVVSEIINKRRLSKSTSTNDLLSTLIAEADEHTGQVMSDDQLKDEVITLLLAGHDTVAAALTWTWYLLFNNPEAENNLLDELNSVLSGRMPSLDDLVRLPYTKMVLDESMRLYPPAWGQPRQAKQDDEINGYKIEKGLTISLVQYVTHRHPEFWDNPESFQPERFNASMVSKRPKFAYFPFGGGQRFCVGSNFAIMEGCLAIASILQRFKFQILENQIIDPDPTFTLRPRFGMKAILQKR